MYSIFRRIRCSRCSRGTSRSGRSPKKLDGYVAAGRMHQTAPKCHAGFSRWNASHIPIMVFGSMLPSSRR
jgi:hypothetical protein